MPGSSLLNVCRFNPTAGGTTDWTYSSAVTGYQSPSAAGVVNGAQYSYRAESSDLSQWEVGTGTYNTGTGVLARTTVLFNSAGTTSKINFSAVPQIAIVALQEDFLAKRGTSSAALAGNVGEYVTAEIASASAITLTNSVSADIVSVSLTAGNWDVWGMVSTNTGGTTDVTQVAGWVTTASATFPTPPNSGGLFVQNYSAGSHVGQNDHFPVGRKIITLASPATLYLGMRMIFTVSTAKGYGFVGAVRLP
jgi:hypothetical protein